MTSYEFDERAAKSKFVAQSRPALYATTSSIITQGKKLETSAKLRVVVSNISSLPLKRRLIYDEIRVFVSRILPPLELDTVQHIHFVL